MRLVGCCACSWSTRWVRKGGIAQIQSPTTDLAARRHGMGLTVQWATHRMSQPAVRPHKSGEGETSSASSVVPADMLRYLSDQSCEEEPIEVYAGLSPRASSHVSDVWTTSYHRPPPVRWSLVPLEFVATGIIDRADCVSFWHSANVCIGMVESTGDGWLGIGRLGRSTQSVRPVGSTSARLQPLVLDALLAANCKQVPLGSACLLIVMKPACMLHCRRR
jgi:hypothetical protein